MAINSNTRVLADSDFTQLKSLDTASMLLTESGKGAVHSVNTLTSDDNFSLSFFDGTRIYASADTTLPLTTWKEEANGTPRETVNVTLRDIYENPDAHWSCPMPSYDFAYQNPLSHSIHPYVFGLWVSGVIRENKVTAHLDARTVHDLRERGFTLYPIMGDYDTTSFMLKERLNELEITTRTIPHSYLVAPIHERCDLLRGITANASLHNKNELSLTSSNIALISSIRTLLSTVGVMTHIKKMANDYKDYYTIVFRDPRTVKSYVSWNHVYNIQPFPYPLKQVDVHMDDPESRYLVGDSLIPVTSSPIA